MTLQTLIATAARDFVRRDYVEQTPLGTLRQEITTHLETWDADHTQGFEGISSMYEMLRGTLTARTCLADVPHLRWICVFAATGSNEGHYIHVDLITQHNGSEGRIPLFLTKTFQGQEAAIQIAAELSRILGV